MLLIQLSEWITKCFICIFHATCVEIQLEFCGKKIDPVSELE